MCHASSKFSKYFSFTGIISDADQRLDLASLGSHTPMPDKAGGSVLEGHSQTIPGGGPGLTQLGGRPVTH